MRKIAIAALGVLLAGCMASVAWAQGDRGSATVTLRGKTVSVDYGRPSLKGRSTDDLLGQLPAGGFWRLGNNTSTTFKTDVNLKFGDVEVPAGEYSIWMQKVEDGGWKLVFNKQHGQWGTQHDKAQDFASVPMEGSKGADSVDLVTITLSKMGGGATLKVQWGTLVQSASFKAA